MWPQGAGGLGSFGGSEGLPLPQLLGTSAILGVPWLTDTLLLSLPLWLGAVLPVGLWRRLPAARSASPRIPLLAQMATVRGVRPDPARPPLHLVTSAEASLPSKVMAQGFR